MRKFLVMSLLSMIAFGAVACSDEEEDPKPKPTADMAVTPDMTPDMTVTPDTNPDTDADPDTDMEADTLYNRLGKRAGIKTVITAFVGRVVADDKINGYFLNNDVDAANLIECLSDQLGNATGGPEMYPNANCRDMKSSHAGLGISKADNDDLTGHLVAQLMASGVSAADIAIIGGVLTAPAFVADIVEDPTNNGTIYQRLGRKPGIAAAVGVDGLAGRVLADPTLAPFFGTGKLTDNKPDRLLLCLTSQVCEATGGPCKYGKESALMANTCKTMAASHAGMTSTAGNPVTIAEFNALVGHLVAELQELNVAEADIMAIGGALAPTCRDIVANGTGCP